MSGREKTTSAQNAQNPAYRPPPEIEPNIAQGYGLDRMPPEIAKMEGKLAIHPTLGEKHFLKDRLESDNSTRYLDSKARRCSNCSLWYKPEDSLCPGCGSTQSVTREPTGEPKTIATEDGIVTRKVVRVHVDPWNYDQHRRRPANPMCFGGDGRGHPLKMGLRLKIDRNSNEYHDETFCESCGDYKGKTGGPITSWEPRDGYVETTIKEALELGAYRIPTNDPAQFAVFREMGGRDGSIFVFERVLKELQKARLR